MNVFLYKVGRNLNRCARLCFSYGITELNLIDCKGELKGNLFSAKIKLNRTKLPDPKTTIVFEKDGLINLNQIKISDYENILIGGESVNLPKKLGAIKVKIPTINNLCLTTESALSIVLNKYYEECNPV